MSAIPPLRRLLPSLSPAVLAVLVLTLAPAAAAAQGISAGSPPAGAPEGGPPILFTKTFFDPVPAGDTVTLQFELINTSGSTTYSFIQFVDDLDATLSGLEALNTPQSGICGPDSSVDGVVSLFFQGGELGPGQSCSFTVTLRVPLEAAPGSYLNQTSGWFSVPFISPAPVASDNLDVTAPEILTKSFTDDPVPAGSPVTLQFTIRNPDPSKSLTAIGFTDNLSAVLPGLAAVGLPQTGICGGGSTLSGTTTLTFSGGSLSAGASCTFSVTLNVPGGAGAGVYANTTSSVSALLAGAPITGAPAEDDLQVGIPGLTKEFTDDPVLPGDTVNLEFSISNVDPTQGYGGIGFVDDLDAVVPGLVALGLPIVNPCGTGSLLVDGGVEGGGGASVIELTGGNLGPGGSCTFSVTLDVPGSAPAGDFLNLTSPLFIGFIDESARVFEGEFAAGAPASDFLQILGIPGLAKEFTDDPVAPGDQVTLEFTIDNNDPVRRARNIAFTDNLGAALAGLSAPSLVGDPLLDVCGLGSQLAAGSGGINPAILEFTGGDLPPGASCTFDVQLQVPGGAPPGLHTNTTSAITAEVGGTSGTPGTPVTGDTASDDLEVAALPVLTKTFTNDPVAPGGTVTLEFKITNTSTGDAATDVAFTDDLGTILPPAGFDGLGNPIPNPLIPQGLPLADPCGAGSQLTSDTGGGSEVLTLTGGSLAAGAMCTFSVVLQVPADAPAGSYLNVTGPVTATIAAMAVQGSAATDALTVVAVPRLSKSFTDDPAAPGGTVTLEFTITHFEATFAATQIAFTDDLTAVIAGLTATGLPLTDPCGAGSRLRALGGDPTKLELFNGSLAANGSCTFDVTLQVPAGATPGNYPNATSSMTAVVGGVPVTRGPAADDLTIIGFLQFTKVITGSPAVPGGTLGLQFTLTNSAAGPALSNLIFTDSLEDALMDMTATGLPLTDPCGSGSSLVGSAGNSVLTLIGGSLAPGASCTFGVTLNVPGSAVPGQYVNVTSAVNGNTEGNGVVAPPASAPFVVADVLSLLKSFTNDPVLPGGTVNLQFTATNAGLDPITSIGFTDDLQAVVAGLTPIGLPLANPCGAGSQLSNVAGTLVLSNGSLAAQSSCIFSVNLQVPANAPFPATRTNVTSVIAGQIGASPVEGPPATDKLRIAGIPVLVKQFTNDPVAPGGTVNLRFTITNTNATSQATAIAFTDDLDAVIPGLVATGLPKNNVCGTGSQLTGTSVISLTGGNRPPGGSCTFNVTLQVPAGAAPGSHPNTTSQYTAQVGGSPVTGQAATDNLQIAALPLLAKEFTDDPVAAGGPVILEFTLTNTSLTLAAAGLTFSDDLEAVLSGLAATDLPKSNVCGAGSQLSGTSVITLTGGNLAADSSCTFSATLAVPAATAPGAYPNTTSTVAGTVGGAPVEGVPATDDLDVSPVPLLDKAFLDDPVAAGDTVVLEFNITLEESAVGATDIGFTDDLEAVIPGLVALGLPIADVCGPGSQLTGPSLLELTGGNLDPGFSCTFGITLQVPSGVASGAYPNLTSVLTADVGGVEVTSPAAADDLDIAGALSVAKSFTDDPVVPGGQVNLQFTLTNSDLSFAVTSIFFTDDLEDTLPGLTAVGLPLADPCGAGSQLSDAGGGVIALTGGTIPPGGSCVFSVTLDVPAGAATAQYPNTTSQATALIDGAPLTAPPARDTLIVSDALALSKSFTNDPASPGGTVILEFTVDYIGVGFDALDIAFTDDLGAVLSGLTATGLPLADVCGAGSQLSGTSVISLTGGTLAPGTSCTFQVTLAIPSAGVLPGNYLNVTSEVTATQDGAPISGPAAQDRLRIVAGLRFQKLTNGVDADVPPGPTLGIGDPVTWEYVVTNTTGDTLNNIVVTDNQGVSVSCPSTSLAPGASQTCTGSGVVQPGQYSNVGTASGISGTRFVVNTDPSHYFGVDLAPPRVDNVDSVLGTGDGTLEECEEARVEIVQLLLTYSEAMNAVAAADPANYQLVATGPDNDLSTLACGGPVGDDVAIPIVGASYDGGSNTAALDLGVPLLGAVHRLFACGTLSDAAGNALDGDGDGLGGDDFVRTFRVELANILANGHFDCDLTPWTIAETIPGAVTHSTEDVDASSVSGSAEVFNPSATGQPESFSLSQCAPLAGGFAHDVETRLRLAAAPGDEVVLRRLCDFFGPADCTGASLGVAFDIFQFGDTGGVWVGLLDSFDPPPAAGSALCTFEILALAGESFDAFLDDVVVRPSTLIFFDGFESGDTSAWSGSVP